MLIDDPNDAAKLASILRDWREKMGERTNDIRAFSNEMRSHDWTRMAAEMVRLMEQPTAVELPARSLSSVAANLMA